jgi:hypothetical protein
METQGKQFEVFKWALVIAALYLIYKLLNKFGLLGETEDEKGANELISNTGIDTVGDLKDNKKQVAAIQKTTGKKLPTSADIKKIQSTPQQYRRLAELINSARGTVANGFDDNEDLIYSSISELKSQFDFSMFSRFFLSWKHQDLFVFLKEFLNDSELARINTIIKNKKPA